MPTPEYCLFWVDWWPICMTKGEWSGWVQAVGSVIAIMAAAGAVWWQVHTQHRLTSLERIAEAVRLLTIVGQFVFEVRAKLRLMDEDEFPHLRRDWTSVEAPVASLEAIPFDRYPVEDASFAVASALLSYRFMRDAYKLNDEQIGLTLEQVALINRSREHTLDAFFKAEELVHEALVVRGSALPKIELGFGDGLAVRTLERDVRAV